MDAGPLPQKLFIAFDVPKEAYAFHATVHKAIAGPHTYARKHLTPPHITVKAPMLVSATQASDIHDALCDLVDTGKVARFAVELGEINMFTKSGALYLSVDGGAIRPQMFTIIHALASMGFARGFYEGLVPHITLAKAHKWNRFSLRQVIEGLDGRPRGEFMIERLRIFTRYGMSSGEWNTSEILDLR